MDCPHCDDGITPNWSGDINLGVDAETRILIARSAVCPACDHLIVGAIWRGSGPDELLGFLWPDAPVRRTPPHVTGEYAQDFQEAASVLPISPKASAAVSRRLLQHIIREKAGIRDRDLNTEIEKLIASGTLPEDLAHDLDSIRTVGNFAAHPIKSTNTGEIVDVEPNEAEWLLDLLDELLQHYFTRPAIRAERRSQLDAKLAETGKPPLKAPPEGA